MKTILLIITFVVSLSFLTGCNLDHLVIQQTDELTALRSISEPSGVELKSAIAGVASFSETISIQLLHKNEFPIGTMTLANSGSQLVIEISGNDQYVIEKLQLWVGNKMSEIPVNKIGQPQPGKFPYKSSGLTEYTYLIDQTELGENYDFRKGEPLFILAHAEAVNIQSGEKKSAWSAGEPLNSRNDVTYTEYYPSIPTGGGGCFPHLAFCGQEVSGEFYFDNTQEESQDIIADNEEIIGTVWYNSDQIFFSFSQDWSLYGESPVESIYGCNSPGGTLTELPLTTVHQVNGNLYIDVPYFLYYVINLNVQYCTTTN
ncbi:hypothetical protein [Maribellus sp. YY47]|uniref:hypothetical protein n=1 Tax=Maribellus sp. YY47 TaxID=2929486 RepID=UPI00200130AA|nr:hypothetical protein [Maribellus sp. YY47]MCK3684427.1 hypothetical protein [Maribellus sp. YY47]